MYKRKREIILVTLVCLITSSIMNYFIKEACNNNVQASSLFIGEGQTKVVMILADYLELEDIAGDKYLSDLYNRGYSALISSRQLGKSTAAKVKLSIGTGKRLLLDKNIIKAINTNNPGFGSVHNGVINQDIEELKSINKDSEYLKYIGYLGDRLEDKGKTTCVIGNSDAGSANRDNILIAMNGSGYADYGDVESTVIYEQGFPGRKKTDFTKLVELCRKYMTVSDFIVMDTGDLARLEHYRSKLTRSRYQNLRSNAVKDISKLMSGLAEVGNKDTTFILISTYPSSNSIKSGYKMTPILAYQAGSDGGLLYSKSTRREGIITSLDIADYIIRKLDAREKSQLSEIQTNDPLNKTLQLKKRLLDVSVMRLPILTWYAVLEIVCAVLALLYMLNMRIFKNRRTLDFIKCTLLVNICAPIVLLYMGSFDISSPYIFFSIFIAGSYFAAFMINHAFRDTISRFAAAAFLVNISLAVDLFRSSLFIRSSVFGYDPIIGARFYGIGNEFAGVYLGSSILLAGCLLQKLRSYASRRSAFVRFVLALYFAVQIYVIGMPTKGANFGATIALVFGCYFFMVTMLGNQVNISRLITLAVIVVVVAGMVVSIDLANPDNSSHIGQFITDIKENGVKVLLSTFSRKLEMNLRLIRYTIWTKVLLCIILIITIMFFKPVRLLHDIFRKYRHLTAAWFGISAGSIAGLIINDSGIVLAATAMIFTGYTILYICLEELDAGKAGG